VRAELELRLFEDRAREVFGNGAGTLMPTGMIRQIRLPLEDSTWDSVRTAETDARSRGETFVTYWHIRRTYSEAELQRADLIQLLPTCMFEPAGEECGTSAGRAQLRRYMDAFNTDRGHLYTCDLEGNFSLAEVVRL
jgi:hypothetical protein